jgi:DNA-directed RNA polymerase subunit RPC12/RpoP
VPSSANLPVLAQLVCAQCGRKSYHPVADQVVDCPECGGELQVVDTFRDRRRVNAPVKKDRRGSSDELPVIDDGRS